MDNADGIYGVQMVWSKKGYRIWPQRGTRIPARQSRNRRTELSAPGWEIRNPKSEIRNKSKNTETPKLGKRGSEIPLQLASNFDNCSTKIGFRIRGDV
jgi:hypothetical protein